MKRGPGTLSLFLQFLLLELMEQDYDLDKRPTPSLLHMQRMMTPSLTLLNTGICLNVNRLS